MAQVCPRGGGAKPPPLGDNVAMGDDLDAGRVAELYSDIWEGGGDIDDDVFLRVLDEAVAAIEDEGIPYVLMGGMVSRAAGRPRDTHDIDLLVRPDDAKTALSRLESAGFTTREPEPQWLYKAVKDDVLVDVLFRASGDVLLDDEMVERADVHRFAEREVKTMCVEDLVVIKALAHKEQTNRHWFDALALLSTRKIDWDYLLSRAERRGVRRVLSLLLYAQSVDIVVPDRVVHELCQTIHDAATQD
jgi:predicted nucleotidyltransferase